MAPKKSTFFFGYYKKMCITFGYNKIIMYLCIVIKKLMFNLKK